MAFFPENFLRNDPKGVTPFNSLNITLNKTNWNICTGTKYYKNKLQVSSSEHDEQEDK